MTKKSASPNGKWANRIVGAGEEQPDQLLANPANFRIGEHPSDFRKLLDGADNLLI